MLFVRYAMQYGVRPGSGGLLAPLALILAGVCAGLVVIPMLRLGVMRSRRGWRGWRVRRRRAHDAATAETRARAMMSELCPHGWRAAITLYEGDGAPAEQPDAEPPRDRVAIDWSELQPGTGRPLLTRRVWAPTISQALEAMVADRRTDETLEQIELAADADGTLWPDV